ncbi:MAG: DUF1439 domain-containing protein [Maribacter sp.]|nr:DUF1439 domain-containing protein [Maribacter sp.]
MKKVAIAAVIVILAVVVGTYFYFSGKEYVVRITESDIRQKLDEKLPITKTYLFIIQVTLENPRVNLINGSNRVNAGLDVIFNITIGKNPKPLGGTVDASGGINYVPEKGEFYLTNPIIEDFEIQGIPSKYMDKVNEALTKALAEYYSKNPFYTLRATDAKQAAARMVLKNVIVEDKELVVTLGI